jgi:hypothetical protein
MLQLSGDAVARDEMLGVVKRKSGGTERSNLHLATS